MSGVRIEHVPDVFAAVYAEKKPPPIGESVRFIQGDVCGQIIVTIERQHFRTYRITVEVGDGGPLRKLPGWTAMSWDNAQAAPRDIYRVHS